MSSNPDGLPPYQEKPSSTQEKTAPGAQSSRLAYPSRLAGSIQSCSISDGYMDHFSITRVSDSTYHLSLTVDPTPIYRIELILGPTKVGNIQIFSASDTTLPALAAARASTEKRSKKVPVGTICTASPTEPDAHWRPVFCTDDGYTQFRYSSEIPVVKVPGRAHKPQTFEWVVDDEEPTRLWWQGPLPFQPRLLHRAEPKSLPFLFAQVTFEPDGGEHLVQIRRGAGIEFELSVILEAFLFSNLSTKVKSA
ncbi:unnamed protein product [Clonostachys byssicola]|uniref:Uncharacterized protein n=1 Tax=Clonostachys byssicola TaxID=160290 RepID=A0A9N9Y1R5_9HYPO|nr:unnamed protein product [Clonostachys byssicola]